MVKEYWVSWIGPYSEKKQEQRFHNRKDAEFLHRMQRERGRKVDPIREVTIPKKRKQRRRR